MVKLRWLIILIVKILSIRNYVKVVELQIKGPSALRVGPFAKKVVELQRIEPWSYRLIIPMTAPAQPPPLSFLTLPNKLKIFLKFS